MNRQWPDLLAEFDQIDPPLNLWHETLQRTPPSAPRRAPRLPQRATRALVAAAALSAALGGMLFASLLNHQAQTARPAHVSRVGARSWLDIVVADVKARIPLSRQLVQRDQCFTPQWNYLATPVFVDLSAYALAGNRADPGAALGREFTSINNRCNVYARQGGLSDSEQTAILVRLSALDRAILAVSPASTPRSGPLDRTVALLLADVRTRLPVAQRLIANSQCGAEVQKIASPIQSDIDLVLLYAAPTDHTVAEGEAAQPLLHVGPDFMRIIGPCFRDAKTGPLSTQEQQRLESGLTTLRRQTDRALAAHG